MSKNKYQLCRVCMAVETQIVFNINFKAVPICEKCSRTIFVQQAEWMSRWAVPEEIRDRKAEKMMEPKGYAVVILPCKEGQSHTFGMDNATGCIHCGKPWAEIESREEFYDKKREKVPGWTPCNNHVGHEFESDGGDCIHCGKAWTDIYV